MLCITLLDVLSGFDEINICTHYMMDGQEVHNFPASVRALGKCKPVYITLPGWIEDISGCTSWSSLPENAKNYIKTVAELSEVPVAMVSVGPGRDQTLTINDVMKA
jgi:adenylosuccinate synthase